MNSVLSDGILIPAQIAPEFHKKSIDTPHDMVLTGFGTRTRIVTPFTIQEK